jgi:uncharacterized protein YjbI with pentapeptide repeats
MLKPSLLLIKFFLLTTLVIGQDIDYSEYPLATYADTGVTRNNQSLKIRIGNELNTKGAFFNKPFKFNHCQFKEFKITRSFLQNCWLDSSIFEEDTVFLNSTAFDTLYIHQSTFKKLLVVYNVQVEYLAIIGGQLPESVIFIGCSIKKFVLRNPDIKRLSFQKCNLTDIDFSGCRFTQTLSLGSNMLNGSILFDGSIFSHNLLLSNLKTSSQFHIKFRESKMPDTLNLSNNRYLEDTVDFSKIDMNSKKKCLVILEGMDISKLKLNYNYFKLGFSENLTIDNKENIYQGLLQNFKYWGFQDSYQKLDIEYKRFHAKQGTFGFLWWIPEYWWEYGYERARIFPITFWAVLFLTIINYLLINYLVSNVYSVGNIPFHYRKRSLNRLWFSFVYTCVIFFSLSLKIDKIKFQNKGGTLYLMGIYLFGIICLAYIANYIIQA